eukprot:525597_1
MMASAEDHPISKELLASTHRRQLMNGETNNVHHEAIIDVLGGIDDILQHLLTSNVILDQQQLDSLHHIIITNTTINAMLPPPEDKTHILMPTLTCTFKDEDSFLFLIFGQENATKILHILNGKIIKCILLLLFVLGTIATILLLVFDVLSVDVWTACCAVLFLFSSIYIIVWIVYANKEAMKLLFRQFVFWFKICHLILYLVTNAIVSYLSDD